MNKELRILRDSINDLIRPLPGYMVQYTQHAKYLDVEFHAPDGAHRKFRAAAPDEPRAAKNILHTARRILIDQLGATPEMFERKKKAPTNGRPAPSQPACTSLALPSYTPAHICKPEPVPTPATEQETPMALSTTPAPANGAARPAANGLNYNRPPPAASEPKAPPPAGKKKLALTQQETFRLSALLAQHCTLVDEAVVYEEGWDDNRIAAEISERCTAAKVVELRQRYIGRTKAEMSDGRTNNFVTRINHLEAQIKSLTERVTILEDLATKPEASSHAKAL